MNVNVLNYPTFQAAHKDGTLVFDAADGKLKIHTGAAWVIVGTQVL